MKNSKCKLLFVFMFVFLCACIINVLSFNNISFSYAETLSQIATQVENLSFTFNGSTDSSISPTFEADYNATEYELSIPNQSGAQYQWYYANKNGYSLLEGKNTNSIKLRNCNQSGYYVCKLTTSDATKRTQEVKVTINPKPVTFKSFEPESKTKVYDGTTKVKIIATYETLDILDEGVEATVVGNTSSADADTNKFVTITKNDITFSTENGTNYVANESSLPNNVILIDVLKRTLTFKWSDTEYFDYDGSNQKTKISVSYNNLQGVKTDLSFSLSGYNDVTKENYSNEFKNAGNYKVTADTSLLERNFDIVNPTKNYYMKRILPDITITNQTFTYNGQMQDAVSCIVLNNSEQTINLKNNTFTTVLECNVDELSSGGYGRIVTYKIPRSRNYLEAEGTFEVFMKKANATIDISNVQKSFVYNGEKQTVNSGAIVDNNEQIVRYSNNSFKNVAEGNNREIGVFCEATENYNYVSNAFIITMEKATINTSNWKWNYEDTPFIYSANTTRSVEILNYPKDLVIVNYNAESSAKNAGVYEARATFTLIDEANYNELPAFESKTWRINKQTINLPSGKNTLTTYNGKLQTLQNSASNSVYTVNGNEQKNAGNYIVTYSLNQPNNFEWENGNSNDYIVNWIIEKATIAKPNLNLDNYDGTPATLGIKEDDVYELIYSDDKIILLGLKDVDNYTWENSTKPYLRIDLGGSFFDGPALPIFVITLTIITLILIAAYFAVHSTIILKRHHKKIALIKARKMKRQLVLASSSSLPENTNFTVERVIDNFKTVEDEIKNNEIDLEDNNEDLEDNTENELALDNKEKLNSALLNNKTEKHTSTQKTLKVENENKEALQNNIEANPNATVTTKPRAKRTSKAKVVEGPKVRKKYVKSRKKENKKKVAQKKKEITAKKQAALKEAEKKKIASKKAKSSVKKSSTTAKKVTNSGAKKTTSGTSKTTSGTTKKTSSKKVTEEVKN